MLRSADIQYERLCFEQEFAVCTASLTTVPTVLIDHRNKIALWEKSPKNVAKEE